MTSLQWFLSARLASASASISPFNPIFLCLSFAVYCNLWDQTSISFSPFLLFAAICSILDYSKYFAVQIKWNLTKFEFVCTVNIWGQSECIEKAILSSVGVFTSNLNVQIDFRLVSDFQTFPRHRTLSLINYFFAAFLSCCPRIITWLQSQSSMKTLVKGNRLETWLWIWEKLKKFGSTFTISNLFIRKL